MQFNLQEYEGDLISCSSNFPDTGAPTASSVNYRYFNQPIEQIPNWNPDKSQILFHGKNYGLWWEDVSDCVDLIDCIEVAADSGSGTDETDKQLKITERRIRPLQDLGILPDNSGCPNIPLVAIDVVTCIKIEGNELVVERKKIYVLDQGDADTDCSNVPLTDCTDGASAASIKYNPETKKWEYS